MPKIKSRAVNLKALLEESDKLSHALRIVITRGARAPVRDGQVTIEMLWRADLYDQIATSAHPRFLVTVVTDSSKDESPADLLRQLADIYEAGEVSYARF